MIYFVSTFLSFNQEVIEVMNNINNVRRSINCIWLVSSPSSEVKEKLQSQDWIHCVIMPDNSYGEGWNNALKIIKNRVAETNSYVMFLGEGDRIEQILLPSRFEDNTVICGTTFRCDAIESTRKCCYPTVVQSLIPIRIGAWTPACAFPKKLFDFFEFPHLKVGADVSVFIYAVRNGYRFKNSRKISVSMQTGGLSSDPVVGINDYKVVLQSYNYHPIVILMICWLKKLNLKLRSK